MSKFKCGDRVRIKLANLFPHLVGREATVITYDPVDDDYDLDIDGEHRGPGGWWGYSDEIYSA